VYTVWASVLAPDGDNLTVLTSQFGVGMGGALSKAAFDANNDYAISWR